MKITSHFLQMVHDNHYLVLISNVDRYSNVLGLIQLGLTRRKASGHTYSTDISLVRMIPCFLQGHI